uniref:Uncharacterized protein n=1 Tax=Salix viminalis TaxID=40686 RepID=A0A6N2JXI3_SALVM
MLVFNFVVALCSKLIDADLSPRNPSLRVHRQIDHSNISSFDSLEIPEEVRSMYHKGCTFSAVTLYLRRVY